MKRTLIDKIPYELSDELSRFVEGVRIFDSSCSHEARVYFIDRDGGYYLKRAALGELSCEAEMSAYFHGKGLGAEVLRYESGECDWLLTARVRGEDCTHAKYIESPKRLCDTIAENLRMLHSLDFSGCPVMNRNESFLALAEKNYELGRYDASIFDGSDFSLGAEDAHKIIKEGGSALRADVLLHGDYCLPNIMLDSWRLSGFIDVGHGGVGDRHVDLFWGAWTLRYNLKTDEYRERFFDAYGRDAVDSDILKIIAAAEIFG